MKNTISHLPEYHKNKNIQPKKGAIIALLSIFKSKPDLHAGSLLTAVEVKTLVRGGEGYELYPFYMYEDIVDGTVECKHEVPMMKKLVAVYHISEYMWKEKEMRERYKDTLSSIKEKGYILTKEISKLRKLGFTVMTEDIPAIFVIAPRHRHREKDEPNPIILIKYGEDKYYRINIWKTEKLDNLHQRK